MKIALAFFGQPRFIKNPVVLETYKKYYLDRYDCDVFAHMWWGEPKNYKVALHVKNVGEMISSDSLDYFNENYNPLKIETEQPREFIPTGAIKESLDRRFTGKYPHVGSHAHQPLNYWSDITYSNAFSQMYSIQKSSRMVMEYASENNIEYDFVIQARYDTMLFDIPDLNKCEKKLHLPNHHGRFPDLHLFFAHKHLEWAGNIFDDIETVYEKIDRPGCERWKFESFRNRFPLSDIQPVAMDGMCVRSIDDNEKNSISGFCYQHRDPNKMIESKGYYK